MASLARSSCAEPESHSRVATVARAARPRVLVLLAAYNGERWIRAQIDSVLGQDDVDVLLMIRDDCSSDGTRREIDRYAGDQRVRISPGLTPTGSAAGNFLTLIRETSADGMDFVAFADQDDLWNPDKLFRACRSIAAGGSAGYSSATLATWEHGQRRVLRPSGAPTHSDFLFEGAGQGCTFVLTAELYERVRQFLSRNAHLTQGLHYHDWAVYALARAWGLSWSFDLQPSMQYRQHSGNDTGARGTVDGVAKRFTLIRRGWYGAQLRVIAQLCAVAAPENAIVSAWCRALLQPDGWRKRWQTVVFCVHGGRRRTRDNLMLALGALAGWI